MNLNNGWVVQQILLYHRMECRRFAVAMRQICGETAHARMRKKDVVAVSLDVVAVS